MKAIIKISFLQPSMTCKQYEFDSYKSNKHFFTEEESARLVHNSMRKIKDSIQIGYKSGNLCEPADDNVSRTYDGSWSLHVSTDKDWDCRHD